MSGTYTAVSLFTGTGGLDIGLEDAGFTLLLATDIDPVACETLRVNQRIGWGDPLWFENWYRDLIRQRCFAKWAPHDLQELRARVAAGLGQHGYLGRAVVIERDVRELTSEEVLHISGLKRGALDLIAGGPPCQSFSRSGKRESVDDERGQLFTEFVRLTDALRPRWFLFENVKGLIQTKTTIWNALCRDCGRSAFPPFDPCRVEPESDGQPDPCQYCHSPRTVWEITRNKRGGALDLILAEFECLGYVCKVCVLNAVDYGAPQYRERLFIIGSRDGERLQFREPTHGEDPELPLFPDLRRRVPHRTVWDVLFADRPPQRPRVDPDVAVLWLKNVVRPHDEPVTWPLNRPSPTVGAHQSAKLAIAPNGVPGEQLARQQWHVLGRRQGNTPPVIVDHWYLTDADLLRLQTFPDFWFVAGTRMQRAFQIGNAVPPLLARAVAESILAASDPSRQAALQQSADRDGVSSDAYSRHPA